MSPEAIVTVGGGTGSPIINEALLRTGQVDHINAIAAMYDSGGATGRRRLDSLGHEVAYSDGIRILLSLIPPDSTPARDTIARWLTHRNARDEVLGQEIVDRFFYTDTGFAQIEEDLRTFGIPLHGRVLPSSTAPAHIVFEDREGRKHIGEHNLDYNRQSKHRVTSMWLEPTVDAFAPAAQAILKAKVIVLSCGSMHGSVLSNALPEGMKDAFVKSGAEIYLVTNVTSQRNETHKATPRSLARLVEKYIGRRPDGLIVPEMTRAQFEGKYPRAAFLYAGDHQFFLGWEDKDLYKATDNGIKIVQHNATSIVKTGKNLILVRHDPVRLADALAKILPSETLRMDTP